MELTQAELDERIAIVKKFKALLKQQRDKFQEYLTVLEKQGSSIENENTEVLFAHTELEQQVVSSIMSLQKVIVPMSQLYQSKASSAAVTEDSSVKALNADLDDLKQKVLLQNEKNRGLLREHITQIRTQIDSFKNPYRNLNSVYAEKQAVGSLVAIEA